MSDIESSKGLTPRDEIAFEETTRQIEAAAPDVVDAFEAAFRQIDEDRESLQYRELLLVREARRRKLSWAAIGMCLGVSRQSVWQRFSDDVEALGESNTRNQEF